MQFHMLQAEENANKVKEHANTTKKSSLNEHKEIYLIYKRNIVLNVLSFTFLLKQMLEFLTKTLTQSLKKITAKV